MSEIMKIADERETQTTTTKKNKHEDSKGQGGT